ncbi:cytochrome b/b6 domain-containing protein [Thiobacillus sp.]|uniref:cytochrome b n=1 Tax=Thiobacillus sp. TaxID=924 RepID=UPI0025EEA8AA|nr:cytochrome b/b6 domain-containing protein [Thiobacillus sp.]MBT9539501.1 cytochrome b/b6 domain-containing protein [Thiobacillus sp.]
MKRYPALLIALHWLTALAVVIAYASSGNPAESHDLFDALIGQVHVISGLAVFALVALRLPARLLLGTPAALPAPRWQARLARAAHIALYALMLLVPLAGWAALADETATFTLAGGIALPLPDAHASWVEWLGETHETLGNAFIWLAGLHALAALVHHNLLRDATLLRMLPLKALAR